MLTYARILMISIYMYIFQYVSGFTTELNSADKIVQVKLGVLSFLTEFQMFKHEVLPLPWPRAARHFVFAEHRITGTAAALGDATGGDGDEDEVVVVVRIDVSAQ